jgi:hypothetical protein
VRRVGRLDGIPELSRDLLMSRWPGRMPFCFFVKWWIWELSFGLGLEVVWRMSIVTSIPPFNNAEWRGLIMQSPSLTPRLRLQNPVIISCPV